MNNSESIKTFATQINDLLSEYIKLHDKILKEAGTFASLFKKIDFAKLYNECADLLLKFNTKKHELLLFENSNKNILDNDESKYYSQLMLFFEELVKTVNLLTQKQHLLFKRSENNKANWTDFNNIEKQYKKSIENYLLEGDKLNALNNLIFK